LWQIESFSDCEVKTMPIILFFCNRDLALKEPLAETEALAASELIDNTQHTKSKPNPFP